MIRSEWSINAALANVEARDRELELSDAIIDELRQVIEDQQDELNDLVRFIKHLRQDFNAPHAKFVLATLGEAKKGSDGNGGKILDAQLAVDGATGKYPEFKGNVATVYTNPLSLGGSGNSHYNGNAETYKIGRASCRERV